MSKFQVNLCMCMHVKTQNVQCHQMPYDIDRLLLMAPFGFWWSATPKFGKATFSKMKIDKVSVHVHAHKKLACTANIYIVHEPILLKF